MRAVTAVFVGAGLLAAFVPMAAYGQGRVDEVSTEDFQTTVSQLESALESRAFMIVARVDHQNMLRMVGASTGGSLTLEFGNANMMRTHLPAHPEIGLEMPMRMYVWEREDGRTVLSYHRPSTVFAAYGPQMREMMGEMMDGMFAEIAADATR